MKFISRKALVAVATASAVAAGTISAPAMAETTPTSPAPSVQDVTTETVTVTPTETADPTVTTELNKDASSAGSYDNEGYLSPKKITEWIAVISTIVTVLGTIITFATKLQDLF